MTFHCPSPMEMGEIILILLFFLIGAYGFWRSYLLSPENLDGRFWVLYFSRQWWMKYLKIRWPSRFMSLSAFGIATLLLFRDQLWRLSMEDGWPWVVGHFEALPTQTRWVIAGLSLVSVVIGLLLLTRGPEYRDSSGGELGSAQFVDPLRTTEWGDVRKGSGIDPLRPNPVLAYLVVVAPTCSKARRGLVMPAKPKDWTLLPLRAQQLAQNILIVGMPGTGKTTKIFTPILLTATVPVIYNDPKASLPLKAQRPKARVYGLDVRGYKSRSETWNPFEELRSKDDVDLLASVMLPDRPGDKDPWVRSGGRDLLEALIHLREKKGWTSICDLADWALSRSPEAWAAELGPTYAYSAQDAKKFGAIADDLKICLKAWSKPRARAISSGPSTVLLEDFIRDGGYVLSADTEENKGPLKVFWAMLIDRLKHRQEGSSPIILAIDELGDAGAIPNLPNALALMRSRGVSVVAGIQSSSLLERTYRDDADAVRDGFGLRLFYLENFPDEDREDLSKWVGERTLQRVQRKKGEPSPPIQKARLLPTDAFGAWGDAGALLARGNRWTWWHPVQIVLPDYPREIMSEADVESDESEPKAELEAVDGDTQRQNVSQGEALQDRFGL